MREAQTFSNGSISGFSVGMMQKHYIVFVVYQAVVEWSSELPSLALLEDGRSSIKEDRRVPQDARKKGSNGRHHRKLLN
jgi:hypothetical protein